MAGSGKTQLLQEAQIIITTRTVFRLVQAACPTRKACNILNGVAYNYSYEYHKKMLSLENDGIKHIIIYEISMMPEQMWNVISHIKQQFGLICCGFGGFKQLKPANEEHIDFRNSWIVNMCLVKQHLCELKHIRRFNESKLLQAVYKCAT